MASDSVGLLVLELNAVLEGFGPCAEEVALDEETFADRVKRLQEVNAVVAKLDPAIRAEAFSILRSYVEGREKEKEKDTASSAGGDTGGDLEEAAEAFFAEQEDGKPTENLIHVAAFLFSQYGSGPFSLQEIKRVAELADRDVPERLDQAVRRSKGDGKALFRRAGHGRYKLTASGQAFLKEEYKVAKGRKKRAENDEE